MRIHLRACVTLYLKLKYKQSAMGGGGGGGIHTLRQKLSTTYIFAETIFKGP